MEKQAIRDLVDRHTRRFGNGSARFIPMPIFMNVKISEIYLKSWLYAGHM